MSSPRSRTETGCRPSRRNRLSPEALESRELLSGAFPPSASFPGVPPGHNLEITGLVGDDGVDTTSDTLSGTVYSGPIVNASEAAAAGGTFQFKALVNGPGPFPHGDANIDFQIMSVNHPTSVFNTALSIDSQSPDGSQLGITLSIPASGLSPGKNDLEIQISRKDIPYSAIIYPFLVDLETVAPKVTSVGSPSPNHTFTSGETVPIVVNFDKPVSVNTTGGTPTLLLGTSPQHVATYNSGDGTSSLTFNYVVQSGDSANPLNYVSTSSLALNGASIMDAASNAANVTLPAPSDPINSLAAAKIIVDTTIAAGGAPVLEAGDDTGLSPSDHITNRTTNLHFDGIAPANATQVIVSLYRRNPDGSSDRSGGPVATVSQSLGALRSYTVTIPGPIAPGLYNVVASFVDAGGNRSPETAPMAPPLLIDTTPPASVNVTGLVPDTGTAGDFITSSQSPSLLVNVGADPDNPPSSLLVSVQDPTKILTFGSASPDANGNASIPLTGANLPGGTTNLVVTATDAAGNTVMTTTSVTVDNKPPQVDGTSIVLSDLDTAAAGFTVPVTTSTSPTIQFKVTDQTFPTRVNTVSIVVTDASTTAVLAQGSVTLGPGGNFTNASTMAKLQLQNLQPGPHLIQITATDSAGNTGSLGTSTYAFNVFTGAATATMGAPGTPVYATVYDIAKSLTVNGTLAADGDPTNGLANRTTNSREFPWTMSFDRTTQTLWVDLRGGDEVSGFTGGGDRVMQIDPATNTYKLYDLQSKSLLAQHPGYDLSGSPYTSTDNRPVGSNPHGIFFDFESHLTPRVWFTQERGGKVSYIDLGTNQLISYDIRSILQANGYANVTAAVHAVTIDRHGNAWISDMDDRLILEISPPPDGSLDSAAATLTVHPLPADLIPSTSSVVKNGAVNQIGPHGIDTVVDDATGQTTLYFTMIGNGHILRLVPGNGPGGAGDQWTDYNVGQALGPGDPNLGSPLFTTIDNLETPDLPADDRVFWADPGGGPGPNAKNVIRALDPNTGLITTWEIPAPPGGNSTAQPNQVYVDREGNVFYIDRQYGFGRLDAASGLTATLDGTTPVQMKPETTPTSASIALNNPVVYNLGTIPSQKLIVDSAGSTPNQSTTTGLNQYDVLGVVSNGKGQGPFRGTLTAGSVVFGSLTQNDQVAGVTFAESARRQMAVVDDPGTPNTPGTGRMAFQVLRDGSLVLSGRSTPNLGDQQSNLTQLYNGPRFFGDVSAMTDSSGIVHVFGRDLDTGGLTQYLYNPQATPQWSFQRLPAPAGVVLASDPSTFLDSVRGVGVMVTTSAGHLLVYDPSTSSTPIDLTAVAPNMLVYSSVGAIEVGGRIYAYGTDQKGDLIEYSYDVAAGPSSMTASDVRFIINASDPNNTFPAVFQDVNVIADGDTREIFVTDGHSQLVHVAVGPGDQITAENVTLNLDKGPGPQIVGYSDYQRPYAGRVYSELSAMIDPVTHDLYVFGTNGRDLIEFHRPSGGSWQVIDLTNNVLGNPAVNLPANRVFGAPAAYMVGDGSIHVLQIDEEGEVVEYYQLGRGTTFNTQNITLLLSQVTGQTTLPPPPSPTGPHSTQIGPRATPLSQNPSGPSGLWFQNVGVLQNRHDRASYRFVATHSGTVVVNLQVAFAIVELDAYNKRRRLIHRVRKPILITDALGVSSYQSQFSLNVVAGETYYFLVKGLPGSRTHTGVPGFGSYTLNLKYTQVTAASTTPVALVVKGPRGPLRSQFHASHRAGISKTGHLGTSANPAKRHPPA